MTASWVSRAWGCGNRLCDWTEWSCWGDGSRKMVPISYGTGKGVKQDRMIGVFLVYTLCSSCPGSACWQKLVRLISIIPLLIRYSAASGVSRGSCVVQGCTISDCQAAVVRYQVSCLWSCCKRTFLLDNVPFQAVGRLSACTCRGPRR